MEKIGLKAVSKRNKEEKKREKRNEIVMWNNNNQRVTFSYKNPIDDRTKPRQFREIPFDVWYHLVRPSST